LLTLLSEFMVQAREEQPHPPLPAGWAAAVDAASGRTCYRNAEVARPPPLAFARPPATLARHARRAAP
jgi:hypothetical protein